MRKRSGEKSRMALPCKVYPELRVAMENWAREDKRTPSQVVRKWLEWALPQLVAAGSIASC
jgi:hypothetical protein